MQILLANPRGFCAGVDRAIDIVERAVTLFGAPIYVRHEVVHNKYVVDRLRTIGAVFVEELTEVPDNATVIFSAHGVPRVVQQEAKRRSLNVFDATCPLVTKVHLEAQAFGKRGLTVLLIGHAGHDEVVGVLGELPGAIRLVSSVEDAKTVEVPDPGRVGVLTQTTLSLDDSQKILAALRARFPALIVPPVDDICYATQNRQRAVRAIAARCELVIVLGSPNSSNSVRLKEVAETGTTAACMMNNICELDPDILSAIRTVGLTAGASTPEWIVERAISTLASHGFNEIEEVVIADEQISFAPVRHRIQPLIPVKAIQRAVP